MAATPTPVWEIHFPGRMAWELDRLQGVARNVQVDQAALASGRLALTFEWPFDDAFLALAAEFPDAYPFLRPHVYLRASRDEWPDRHVNPVNGEICLLGRNTEQWTSAYDLATLLGYQLRGALLGEGKEDPQAEPADFWWNTLAPIAGSYCLVDSGWDLSKAASGRVDFRYHLTELNTPSVQGYVERVIDEAGATIAKWTAPLPPALVGAKGHLSVRWHRSKDTLLPQERFAEQLVGVRKALFGADGVKAAGIGPRLSLRPYIILHPIEALGGSQTDGWIFAAEWGSPAAFKSPRSFHVGLVPMLRAGRDDLGLRVPDAAPLKGKTVAIFGVGAIGAPIALELMRNGAGELRLVDHDLVEPGNSERWPLGAVAWGHRKANALALHAGEHFPGVAVKAFDHHLGNTTAQWSDETLLDAVLDGVDLVIDAAVSAGVSYYLWHRSMQRKLALIKVGATPTLGGGSVVYHFPGDGCPVCLQHARITGTVPTPPGSDDYSVGIQPPGCGERTFTGTDYDLQELSLQCTRGVVDVFAQRITTGRVQTLALQDNVGNRILPRWEEHALAAHPQCCAKPAVGSAP